MKMMGSRLYNDEKVILVKKVLIPIAVVLASKVISQGVLVHSPQQPVPSLLLHVTYSANIIVVIIVIIIRDNDNIKDSPH